MCKRPSYVTNSIEWMDKRDTRCCIPFVFIQEEKIDHRIKRKRRSQWTGKKERRQTANKNQWIRNETKEERPTKLNRTWNQLLNCLCITFTIFSFDSSRVRGHGWGWSLLFSLDRLFSCPLYLLLTVLLHEEGMEHEFNRRQKSVNNKMFEYQDEETGGREGWE